MALLAFPFSAVALIISIIALVSQRRLQVDVRREPRAVASDNDEMLHAAWLEELESRGEAVLRRIAEAEARSMGPQSLQVPEQIPHQDEAQTYLDGVDQTTPEPKTTEALKEHISKPQSVSDSDDKREETPRDAVRRLAEQGHTPGEIARRLHIGRGEVELILDLSEE